MLPEREAPLGAGDLVAHEEALASVVMGSDAEPGQSFVPVVDPPFARGEGVYAAMGELDFRHDPLREESFSQDLHRVPLGTQRLTWVLYGSRETAT